MSSDQEFTLGPEAIVVDGAPDERTAPGGRVGIAQAIGARNLIIIIVTMPLVFLGLVVMTLAIFGSPGKDKVEEAQIATNVERLDQPVGAIQGPVSRAAIAPSHVAAEGFSANPSPILLPEGVRASAISLDGDRVALHVEGPQGAAIILYDTAQGRVLQQIAINDAPENLESFGAPSLNPARDQ